MYITMFSNKHPSFHLWGEQNMVKYQKVSKLYDHDCLQNFILLFMSLMLKTAFIVKNSHIFAGIYFIFLKNVLYQTLKSFSGKFGSH